MFFKKKMSILFKNILFDECQNNCESLLRNSEVNLCVAFKLPVVLFADIGIIKFWDKRKN